MELKKINILSLSKVAAIFGFILGIFQIILLFVLQSASNVPIETLGIPQQVDLTLSSAFSVLALSTIIYFIVGALTALIYNIISKYIGGIILEFNDKKLKKKK